MASTSLCYMPQMLVNRLTAFVGLDSTTRLIKDSCGEDGHGQGYKCTACNLDLHKSCATVNMAEEKVIQHPSHPGHCLRYVRYSHAFVCDGCREYVLGNGYRCAACDFDLRISCATVKMAEEKVMQHPSHPGHWLSYVRYPRGYKCDSCGESISGRGYNCAACDFNLYKCCATAPPVLDQSFHGGNGKWVHFQMKPPGGTQTSCSSCGRSVSGLGYYCTSSSCNYALHPTCALLPRRAQVDRTPPEPGKRKIIRHPSHPEHGLNYVRYPDGFHCSGCREDMQGKGYRCGTCDFDLHECCAMASPVLHNSLHGGKGKWVQFQTRPPSGTQTRCLECERRMLGFGYYCTRSSCGYALHPTCASLKRSHTQVEAPPTRHTQAEAAPRQPDNDERRRRGRAMAIRGGKVLGKLAVGAITGDPTSIVSALVDLVVSDDD
ncbi:uncharacterized protein LOC131047637 [Cryptomeria japonica]|uniref:uncharacterized protein LOC131047637 n=1 Tax=Cryptomeria japonica TaxID=3369 RepID=UPI0027D9E54A|nr:uncharacterized protein LOC131047637 [Cryptomeria japonica]